MAECRRLIRSAVVGATVLAFVVSSPVPDGMVPATVPQSTADQFGAKQLDGSAPVYLIRRNPASTKWVLFLEGGGWCFGPTPDTTIASCAARAGFKAPSSGTEKSDAVTDPPVSPVDYGGILGSNCTTNPGFCEWNFAFLHYKDGSSFGSYRPDPIIVDFRNGTKGAQMWMRGRASFDAIIHDLQTTYGMSAATEVILSGGSAGGLAVYYQLDHLGELLGKSVKLTGMPDAGFFLDAADITGDNWYRAQFQGADPVWNVTESGGTNLACLAAYPKTEQWKCLMAQYIVPHLKTPVYVMNSAYDAYQLQQILKTPCQANTTAKPCDDTASQTYGELFKKTVGEVLANPANGVYSDSCYVHEQNVNYCSNQGIPNCVGWSPLESGSMKWGYKTAVTGPDGNSYTPQQAFTSWYFTGKNRAIIDSKRLQANPSCIYLGRPV